MTIETYENLSKYIGSKDDFTDDLLNMGFSRGYSKAENDYFKKNEEILKQQFDCGKSYGYEKGRKDTFDAMKKNCKHSHWTYDEDSHCSGYEYCMLKGFDCVCCFENCEQMKEDSKK